MSLTVKALRAHKDGERDEWVSDGATRGSGALWARLSRRGVSFYFRYTHDKKKRALPIGAYDESGTSGLTLVRARDKAGELSKIYQSGITDLHGHLEREREAAARALRAADEAARREQEAAQRSTLKQLVDAYVGHLERQNKQSTRDVRSILTKHVLEAAPDLAVTKAAEVPSDEFVRLIGKLVEAGKGRTAGKCRSYLRAAYSLAIRSRTDPDAPLTIRAFGITANPIADIGALGKYNRTRDRVLNAVELVAFLRRLEALPAGAQKDALRLCVFLGGQRPAQLLRARPGDVDLTAGTLTLYDPKGARQQPRQHIVPLTVDASAILERRLRELDDGESLFSTGKQTVMRIETISALVTELAAAMVKANEAREAFQLRDVRRTVETMLAALRVSRDVRAQLQSHGLGGVQQRHYDRHDYMLEKRQALGIWTRHLKRLQEGKAGEVVPLPKTRSMRRAIESADR
ncbi:MAG: tyrosine-type recombinase/integrase [Steroidobacteraceae bacterium]